VRLSTRSCSADALQRERAGAGLSEEPIAHGSATGRAAAEAGAPAAGEGVEPAAGQPLVFDTGRAMRAAWRWRRSPGRRATLHALLLRQRPAHRRAASQQGRLRQPQAFNTLGTSAAAAACWWCIRQTPFRSVNDVISFSKKEPEK